MFHMKKTNQILLDYFNLKNNLKLKLPFANQVAITVRVINSSYSWPLF